MDKADVIKKIEEIEGIFTKERIEKSKKRVEALYSSNDCQIAYTFTPITFNYYDDVFSVEERLERTLEEILMRGNFNDDYIPSIFPGCRQAAIPEMFGAKEIAVGGDYGTEAIVEDVEDLEALPCGKIASGSILAEVCELYDHVMEKTDGRLFLNLCDMQGPNDVFGQIAGYENLFVSAMTDFELYHETMTKIVDAIILVIRTLEKKAGDRFIPTHLFGWNYIPKEVGVSISADSIVMVSAEYFDKYYKPYLERISKEFGGITIHSCGDFAFLAKSLLAVDGIKGINAGQMTIEELWDAGISGEVVLTAYCNLDDLEKTCQLIAEKGLRVMLSIDAHIDTTLEKEEMINQIKAASKKTEEIMAVYGRAIK